MVSYYNTGDRMKYWGKMGAFWGGVEYLWSHWKQHELPNFCPKSFGELSHYARKALRRMRRRPTLVMAFWEQAELFPL